MSFAISPDGRRLVFVAAGDGQTRLWLRALDASTAQPLAGTEGATLPFWSPDSRSIAFFAVGKLKRLDIGAGVPRALADVAVGQGGTWSQQDVILFSRARISPLYRVPATGGEAVQATKLATGQTGHRFPQFLPDGKRFLLYASGQADAQGIYVGALDGETLSRVSNADSAAAYSAGWLMFNRGGALIARRFDPAGATLTGDPVTVAEQVGFDNRRPQLLDVGRRTDRLSERRHKPAAAWLVRPVRQIARRVGNAGRQRPSAPALSPDGRRVAANRVVQGNTNVWIVDERPDEPVYGRSESGPVSGVVAVWGSDRVSFEPGWHAGHLCEGYERGRGCHPAAHLGANEDPDGLVARRPLRPVRDLRRSEDGIRRLGIAPRGRPQTLPVCECSLRGTKRGLLAGRPLGRLSVERVRTARGLRPAVSRVGRRTMAGLDRRRDLLAGHRMDESSTTSGRTAS